MGRRKPEQFDSSVFLIKYRYKTGDSNGSREVTATLELTWACMEKAVENLRRIRDHYLYYENTQGDERFLDYRDLRRPKAWLKNCEKQPWFVPESAAGLILVADTGKPCRISAPWCGYFESLLEAEIVVELPKITF